MFQDNISFVTHSSDGCYGTDTVPLPPQFCRCLYFFSLWLTPNFAYSWIFVACPPLFPTEIRVTCLQRGWSSSLQIIFCLGMRWALAYKAWTEIAPTSLGNAPALSNLFLLVFVLQILCVSHGLAGRAENIVSCKYKWLVTVPSCISPKLCCVRSTWIHVSTVIAMVRSKHKLCAKAIPRRLNMMCNVCRTWLSQTIEEGARRLSNLSSNTTLSAHIILASASTAPNTHCCDRNAADIMQHMDRNCRRKNRWRFYVFWHEPCKHVWSQNPNQQ